MAIDIWGIARNALTMFAMVASIAGVVVFVVVGFKAYSAWKRFNQYVVRIWEKDGFGQVNEHKDVAGVFVDKDTGDKRLWLRKSQVGLSPDNIPYLPMGRQKVVMLLKVGLKNFLFIRPVVSTTGLELMVGEEDVNWAVHTYEKQKKMFIMETLMPYLPFIALGFVTIVILLIFIYFFREFDTLGKVATQLARAAEALRDASAGTVVIE